MKIIYTFLMFTLLALITACASTKAVSAAESTNEVISIITKGTTPAYYIKDQRNAGFSLKRGQSYTIEVNAPGHPLWIKTNESTGTADAYVNGVTGNGVDKGMIKFTVPADAPDVLFYNCEYHDVMRGKINISN